MFGKCDQSDELNQICIINETFCSELTRHVSRFYLSE